ncbi:MAG: hypothetical protein ACR2IK_18415 [Chloroflexota bacterium]
MATELRYGTWEEAGMDPARIRQAAGLAQQWVTEGHTSGLVVLAARRGVVVLHEAFGHLTPEPIRQPCDATRCIPLPPS